MPKYEILNIDSDTDEIHVYTEDGKEVGAGAWHKPYDIDKVVEHIVRMALL